MGNVVFVLGVPLVLEEIGSEIGPRVSAIWRVTGNRYMGYIIKNKRHSGYEIEG